MLEVSEVGNEVGNAQYKSAIPDLRVGLINAQYDLRDADFPVIIWIAAGSWWSGWRVSPAGSLFGYSSLAMPGRRSWKVGFERTRAEPAVAGTDRDGQRIGSQRRAHRTTPSKP